MKPSSRDPSAEPSSRRASRSGPTWHTFQHSFATDLLEDDSDICTVHTLLGHKDVTTPMIDTHVLNG